MNNYQKSKFMRININKINKKILKLKIIIIIIIKVKNGECNRKHFVQC